MSWISSFPVNLPGPVGANSTEMVQVPPLAAIVSQVLAITLYGGVAAGAAVSVIETGLELISVTFCDLVPVPADIWPYFSALGCIFKVGANPLPLSLTGC